MSDSSRQLLLTAVFVSAVIQPRLKKRSQRPRLQSWISIRGRRCQTRRARQPSSSTIGRPVSHSTETAIVRILVGVVDQGHTSALTYPMPSTTQSS